MVGIIIAIIATLVIAVPVSAYVANTRSKKAMEITIGNAEDKAREIIDEAIKAADAKKREASLEVKEETIKARHDFEKETKERRAELQKYEQRVLSKEETVEKKATVLERKEQSLTAKEKNIDTEKAQLQELQAKHLQELERISGLTSDQAKEQLLSAVKEDVKHETAMYVKEMETRAKEDARKKAKEYVVTAIQKCAVDHVAETTISLVQLPNDEMKGRIIGREGRNIRTLETLTGVDLIIDDTPGISIAELRSKCRRMKQENGLSMIIIDYLQLMSGSGGRSSDSRQQEISDISRSLKAVARELSVPVLALSQLSRAVEQRPDHRPMLSDLRESGAIEQDADVVMFIYRDDYYNHDSPDKGISEIIIAKQRNGPIGTVQLAWLPEYTKFANLENDRKKDF